MNAETPYGQLEGADVVKEMAQVVEWTLLVLSSLRALMCSSDPWLPGGTLLYLKCPCPEPQKPVLSKHSGAEDPEK